MERWQATIDPVGSLNAYLAEVYAEAVRRGYRFDRRKLGHRRHRRRLKVSRGQVDHEWTHLLVKLRRRDPARYRVLRSMRRPVGRWRGGNEWRDREECWVLSAKG